jgi:hypothetical protein
MKEGRSYVSFREFFVYALGSISLNARGDSLVAVEGNKVIH